MQEKEANISKHIDNSKKETGKIDFVKWFSELNKDSGSVAGGKGANLAEIYNLKIPVPPGFVVTAQAYDYFIEKAGIAEKIEKILGKIDYEDTNTLNQATKEIREIMEKATIPKEMEEEILEAYEALGAEDSYKDHSAHSILKKTPEAPFVAVRSSATTEDLAEASFAGQQDTFLNVKGNNELLKHIKKAFSSLFTPRATYYREKKGFKHKESSLAVIVQKMVDSDKSGVIFSKDPSTGDDNVTVEAVFGLGEGIVSGRITPDRYVLTLKDKELEIRKKEIGNKKIAITRDSSGSKAVVKLKDEKSKQQVLKEYEIKKLGEIALKLEAHYKKPQDIEFAIETDNLYIVQTRPITTLGKKSEIPSKELKGEVILKGLAASPGIGSGKIKIVRNLEDLGKVNKGDVLVTTMTNPDMVVTMQKSAAIVTDEGGLTAHAAIVSREMGIPAVVGTQEATTKLKEGEIITVDGFTGKVYKGKVAETVQKEIKAVTSKTKTEIKVIIDLPSYAERAAKTKLTGVGLARIEGIIAENGKHPAYFLEKDSVQDYEEIIFKGISEIADYFEEIWVRTSDIRSDEFQNLEGSPKQKEANPMLGMHGIRYGIKHPEILKAELKAMKRVSEKNKKIGILSPQVISVQEIKSLKKILEEIQFKEAKVGVMIETPASVQIIKELCEEGIDFVSFGTNDLTQYTLAVDRGNRQVQPLYNELDPSILYQLEHVLKICKENDVETSICGQAGSRKEMVKFLVENRIDSISVNADVAADISEFVSELEKGKEPEVIVHDEKPAFTIPQQPETQTEETKQPPEKEQEEAQEKREEPEQQKPVQKQEQTQQPEIPTPQTQESKQPEKDEKGQPEKQVEPVEQESEQPQKKQQPKQETIETKETEQSEEPKKEEQKTEIKPEEKEEIEERFEGKVEEVKPDKKEETEETKQPEQKKEKQETEIKPEPEEQKREEPEKEQPEETEEEFPKIRGIEHVQKQGVEELAGEEMGVVGEIKKNVEKGEEAIVDVIEKIEEKIKSPEKKQETKPEERKEETNKKPEEESKKTDEEQKQEEKEPEKEQEKNEEVLDIF